MPDKTEDLPCPDCGLPVELPVREDLAYDERLCNSCYELDELKRVSVAYNTGDQPQDRVVYRSDSIKDAESWIAIREMVDPAGVHSGYYSINAPEEMT